jgi:hypothetical protein
MTLIPYFSVHTTKPKTVSYCGAISTCHIWTPKYAIEYMCLSKSIGLSLMIMVYLSQSKTTNFVLSTLAMPHQVPSRKFSMSRRRHPSCGVPFLPSKKSDKYVKLPMDPGHSKLFLLPNPIRSMYKISTNSSGPSASTTSH